MADQDRYNDRYYGQEPRHGPGSPRGPDFGPGDRNDGYRQPRDRADGYRRPSQPEDDQRSYAPYGSSGPIRSGGRTYDGDGHPDGRYSQGRSDHGPHDHHQAPNVRGGRGDEARSWWNRASDTVQSWLGDDDAQRRHRWDEMRHASERWPEGPAEHRGRGPKGYRRSDERIREDVNDRLTDDDYLDASSIEVQVEGGEVTLNGTVTRRNDKRRAENLAEDISGVTHVQNNLRVQGGETRPAEVLDPTLGPTF